MLKDLRAFGGLCAYYRKFIAGFSNVAAPLFALTRKDRPFEWNETCQVAFDKLKVALTTSPVLSLPLDYGIGAVLSQQIDGEEKVVWSEKHKSWNCDS